MARVLLLQLRRDRVTLAIWILGAAGLLTVTGVAVVEQLGDSVTEILTIALATPALLALRGIPNGDSLGSAMHFQGFAWIALLLGLMNVFLATRHGRGDEESGRRELVLATPVGRLTPLVATTVLALAANGAFFVLAVGGYLLAGFDAAGAAVSAGALAAVGLAFFGIAALAGQLTPTSRTATGVGVTAVLVAYALRAAGDALGTPDLAALALEPAWPSYLSPIGWGQLTRAFTENDLAPLAPLAALSFATLAVAFALQSRRDLGASLIVERSGAAGGGPRGALALAFRVSRGSIAAWAVGSAVLGLLLGSLVTAVANSDVSSPALEAVIASLGHGQGDLGRLLLTAILGLVAILAAAAGVQGVLRLRDEEVSGRAEEVLAAPVPRAEWFGAGLVVGVGSTLAVLLAAGAAGLVGFLLAGNPADGWLTLGQALLEAPAALAPVALAAFLVAVLPRAAVTLAWVAFGALAVWGLFGALFDPPEWALRLSPFAAVPTLADVDAAEWGPLVIAAVVAVALVVVSFPLARRRDLTA